LIPIMVAAGRGWHAPASVIPIDRRSAVPAATPRLDDRARHRRLAREYRTLSVMVWMHCHDLHGEDDGPCNECRELLAYAARRIDRCVFGAAKPTCANCTVHCYNTAMRNRVRAIMRYAGPRMLLRHPVLALAHSLDGRRPAAALPAKVARTEQFTR
jgi:hypothetical protein